VVDIGDDDLLVFVRNIRGVLLTRGMLETYVYLSVCDPSLRNHLAGAAGKCAERLTAGHPCPVTER